MNDFRKFRNIIEFSPEWLLCYVPGCVMYVLYILECSCIDRIPRADVLEEGEEQARGNNPVRSDPALARQELLACCVLLVAGMQEIFTHVRLSDWRMPARPQVTGTAFLLPGPQNRDQLNTRAITIRAVWVEGRRESPVPPQTCHYH